MAFLFLTIIVLLSTRLQGENVTLPGCRKSTVADYNNGYLCSIPTGSTFKGLPTNATALRLLDRGQNVIDWRTVSLPSRLPHLEVLQLDVTQIRSLPTGAFRRLSTLRHVQLFRTVDRAVAPLSVGVELHIGTFDGLSEVRTLILSDLQLTRLPSGVLRGLTNLDVLNLNRNNLVRLPLGTFNDCCGNLSTLSVATNYVEDLREIISSELRSLRILDVHENFLVTLKRGDLDSLENLGSLDISRNRIVAIEPGTFTALRGLKVLDLSGNRLGIIRGISNELFSGLIFLEDLNLSNNSLSTVNAEMFKGLDSLERIRLNRNIIRKIESGVFSNLKNLETISLRENELQGLSAGVFSQEDVATRNRITMDLSENPWNCDCDLAWLYSEYASQIRSNILYKMENSHEMLCSSPSNTTGMTVEQAVNDSCQLTIELLQTETTELAIATTETDVIRELPNKIRTSALHSDDATILSYGTMTISVTDTTTASNRTHERLYRIAFPDTTEDPSSKQGNIMFISILSVTLVLLTLFILLTVFLIRHATRVQQQYPVEEFEEMARGRLSSSASVDTNDGRRIDLRTVNRISILYRPEV